MENKTKTTPTLKPVYKARDLYFDVITTPKNNPLHCQNISNQDKRNECVNKYKVERYKLEEKLEFCYNPNHNCDMIKIEKEVNDFISRTNYSSS